jgi:hypothetical protein
LLLLSGCSKQVGVPLSFHLSDQKQGDPATLPKDKPALVVKQVEVFEHDAAQRKVSIKLLPTDSRAFEKLTADNIGKTLIFVQGSNVLMAPKNLHPIPAGTIISFSISTNLDFESVYQELLKLSKK